MIIRKEVEFDEDEVTTINKFRRIMEELITETEISERSIISYLMDRSDDEIAGTHDLETIENFY